MARVSHDRGNERVDLLDCGVGHVQPFRGYTVERGVVEHLVTVRVRVRVRVGLRVGVGVGAWVGAVLSGTTTESA